MEILSNSNQNDDEAHYMIRDKDSGKVFDLRVQNDYEKINDNLEKLSNYNLKEEEKKFYIECHKLNQKIKTKFFKHCERGEIKKILSLLDTNKSPDLRAPINEKYLHGYTVLHVAVSNSNI